MAPGNPRMPEFRLERRAAPLPWATAVAAPVSALVAVAASSLLFVALGYPAAATLHAFFIAPFETLNGISELALKASPLILVALGLVACFRANVWPARSHSRSAMPAARSPSP